MTRVPLLSGAYQSRSIIAGAQRSVNLYPEENPEDSQAPVPTTTYPTPGLTFLKQLPDASAIRGLYRATNGELYAACGGHVYLINSDWSYTAAGAIPSGTSLVSMKDNGLCLMIVDGSVVGYVIDLTSLPRTVQTIQDSNFLGASKVDYIDTFFVLNQPGTSNFYLSLSNVTAAMATTPGAGAAFDPLYVVAKTGGADPIATLVCAHREVWILGTLTSEVWVDMGTPDFPLGELPGTFIGHGCAAPNSAVWHDNMPFWLSQDKDGSGIVVMGAGYNAQRISTHAIEQELSKYATINDAIGYVYQLQGHVFYVITFPTANVTWACEIATKKWHQWASIDTNGNLNRHRANYATEAYGIIVAGDYQNGTLYQLDPNAFTDNGVAIPRIQTFPHMLDDGRRVTYKSFIADLQSGQLSGGSGPTSQNIVASLRWSDTRGASWSDAIQQQFGTTGAYGTSIKWTRLGMARDRVFELSWSVPTDTALNGAFVEVEECET